MTELSIDWVRALADADMMAIEAIVSRICRETCEGLSGYALFDGGAHTGYHTVRMAEQPGCDVVYAVEADPTMAKTLKANLRAAKADAQRHGVVEQAQLAVVEMALQNDPAVKSITWKSSTSHAGRSSILSDSGETIWADSERIEYRGEVTVPATTIDTILKREARPLPFLKLDLEGADILSLFGATRTLQHKRPVVAFENSVHAPKVHGFSLEEFSAYLAELDYVAMSFAGKPLRLSNWFGFFEAWLVPADGAAWLSERLQAALRVHERSVADLGAGGSAMFDPARIDRNMDETVIAESDPTLPSATRTVGWRNLSYAVAQALWQHPLRHDQAVERETTETFWEEARDDYLIRIRAVMRSLARENLDFRQLPGQPEFMKSTQDWAVSSGRLAWLLWLSGRRASHAPDETAEKALWASQAADYRAYVRGALADLRELGIVFADECELPVLVDI